MAAVAAPAARAAALLRQQSEPLAREVTDALYRERPGLWERFGQRGWDKCLQDMRHNWEHLAPAVELERPVMFATYARWVDGLLVARGVPTGELVRCLELMDESARARMEPDEAAAVARCLDAGLEALRRGEGA